MFGIRLIAVWLLSSTSLLITAQTDVVTNATIESKPSWPDIAQLWMDPTALTAEEAALWEKVSERLVRNSSKQCRYTRITAICEACEGVKLRETTVSMSHSLIDPSLNSFGTWFDTAVMHDVDHRHEEIIDPDLELKWELLTMDGGKPTPRQYKDYRDEKLATNAAIRRGLKGHEEKPLFSVFDALEVASLLADRHEPVVLSRSENEVVFGFERDKKASRPLERKLKLTLAVSPQEVRPLWFDLHAPKKFWPQLSVRVKEFNQRGIFQLQPGTENTVLSYQTISFRARLTGVFAIQYDNEHWYKDYTCTSST